MHAARRSSFSSDRRPRLTVSAWPTSRFTFSFVEKGRSSFGAGTCNILISVQRSISDIAKDHPHSDLVLTVGLVDRRIAYDKKSKQLWCVVQSDRKCSRFETGKSIREAVFEDQRTPLGATFEVMLKKSVEGLKTQLLEVRQPCLEELRHSLLGA